MSRHSKRISVFDRLGPDTERDHPPPPPHPPPVRHRHYSDKHTVTDDRSSRDKRDVDRMSRKRRHGYDDEPMGTSSLGDSRTGKRHLSSSSRRSDPRDRSYSDKSRRLRSSTSLSSTEDGDSDEDRKRSRSSSKKSKSSRKEKEEKGTSVEIKDSDHSHVDDDRPRRKRDREDSTSEGEEPTRESKRRKADDGKKIVSNSSHHQKLKQRKERKDEGHRRSGRQGTLYDSLSDSEMEGHGTATSDIDWFTLAKMVGPKSKEKKTSALDSFKAGAIFYKMGVLPSLAGPELTSRIEGEVNKFLDEKYSEGSVKLELDETQHHFGSSLDTYISELMNSKNVIDTIGPCRQALVASVDFSIRKKLRNF